MHLRLVETAVAAATISLLACGGDIANNDQSVTNGDAPGVSTNTRGALDSAAAVQVALTTYEAVYSGLPPKILHFVKHNDGSYSIQLRPFDADMGNTNTNFVVSGGGAEILVDARGHGQIINRYP